MKISSFLNKIRQSAHQRNIPILSTGTEKYLRQHLPSHTIKNALEIGSAICYSSIVIAQCIDPKYGNLTTFEVSFPPYNEGIDHISSLWIHSITNYYANFNSINLQRYLYRKLDFVFIDGRKSEYHVYLQKIIPYLAQDYLIICDDVIKFKNKLKSLYNFLDQNQINYTVHQLDPDDGILVIHNDAWLLQLASIYT